MNLLANAKWTALALLFAPLAHTIAIGNDKQVIPATAVMQADLDQAISWIQEAKRNYAAVKDYSCMLVSQEKVNGKLLDANYIQLRMKTEPFSVSMRWVAPESNKGQEVVFVVGKNNNRMRVKSKETGILGFVSIETNDKRVMAHSRHTINEAGIGNLIDQTILQWDRDRKVGKTTVTIAPYTCNGKACQRIEMVRTVKDPSFYCYRSVIYLEKDSKLPIRLDNYDWPTAANPNGELLESFSYVNLEFNVGVKDAEFNK